MSNRVIRAKEKNVARLQEQLSRKEKELRDAEQQMVAVRGKERYKKLLRAGRIVEDAGLLDDYNPNDLYLLLVMNRNILRKSKSAPDQGRFDLMKGLDI